MYYLGIDIGGTYIKWGILSNTGEIIENSQFETPKEKATLYENIKQLFTKYSNYDLQGIGMSVPGFVNDEGYLETAGAIKYLYKTNLKEELEEYIKTQVRVENDANCSALAEKWIGNAKNKKSALIMTIGTGVGGAIILNDELIRGANNRAGEVGFMVADKVVNDDSVTPQLSKTGSIPALMNKYFIQANERVKDGKEVYELADKGNRHAKIAINNFYQEIAVGIFNIIMVIDPEIVLLGGAISRNEHFIKGIEERLKCLFKENESFDENTLPIIKATKLLNNAGFVGAVSKFISMEEL